MPAEGLKKSLMYATKGHWEEITKSNKLHQVCLHANLWEPTTLFFGC